ncbi:MAG: glycosyltransferase family 39 protein [Gemmatimonadota bacterium]
MTSASLTARRRLAPGVLVAGAFGLLLLPRLLALGADPPQDLESGFLFDAGNWWKNARQDAVFGQYVMDGYNPAIYVAPLYTLALRGMYALAGVGFAQSHLLSTLAGFLTCILFYLGLRPWYGAPGALLPTLLLGLSFFMVTIERSGLVEPLQLVFVVGMASALLAATRRPAWAAAAGACFVGSLLVKGSTVIMLGVAMVFWTLHWSRQRRDPSLPRFRWRAPIFFGLSAAVLGAIVLVALALPHQEEIRQTLALGNMDRALGDVGQKSVYGVRINFLGWSRFGLRPNGFFRQDLPLLAAVALLAATRLGRTGKRRPDLPELLGWAWLGVGLAFVSLLLYQPDRRCLFLTPAVALLAGIGIQRVGFALPARSLRGWTDWRPWAVGALIGGFLGFYSVTGFHLARTLVSFLADMPLGRSMGLSWAAAGMLAWWAFAGLGAAGAAFLARKVSRPIELPAGALLAAFLLFEPLRFGLYLAHPSHSIRDVARWIAGQTNDWPRQARLIKGDVANTFAMETRLQAPSEPLHDEVSRGRPITAITIGMARDSEAMARGFVPCWRQGVWIDDDGSPRFEVMLYVRPHALPAPVSCDQGTIARPAPEEARGTSPGSR